MEIMKQGNKVVRKTCAVRFKECMKRETLNQQTYVVIIHEAKTYYRSYNKNKPSYHAITFTIIYIKK